MKMTYFFVRSLYDRKIGMCTKHDHKIAQKRFDNENSIRAAFLSIGVSTAHSSK